VQNVKAAIKVGQHEIQNSAVRLDNHQKRLLRRGAQQHSNSLAPPQKASVAANQIGEAVTGQLCQQRVPSAAEQRPSAIRAVELGLSRSLLAAHVSQREIQDLADVCEQEIVNHRGALLENQPQRAPRSDKRLQQASNLPCGNIGLDREKHHCKALVPARVHRRCPQNISLKKWPRFDKAEYE